MTANDTPANPPAALEWRQIGEGVYVTEHNGKPWTLAAHSAWLGKAGWSGTNEWHLHEGDERTSQGSEGRFLGPAGRGTQFHKTKLVRAQKLAAWIVANPDLAATMVLRQIEDIVFDDSDRSDR